MNEVELSTKRSERRREIQGAMKNIEKEKDSIKMY